MSKSWLVAIIASIFLIALSLIPTYWHYQDAPLGKVYLGTHNNALDYPMFVAVINRAQRGKWLNKAVFTSESQPQDFVHWIYIPLGKFTSLLSINAIATYQLGRIIFGLALSLATFYFISILFGNKTTLLILGSFFLTLFSAGFSRFAHINGRLEPSGSYLSWWTGGDVLRRATFQPHAMLKNTLLLLILALFTQKFKESRKINAKISNFKFQISNLVLSLAGFLLGIHDPMNTLSIFGLLGLYSLFQLFKNRLNLAKTLAKLPIKLFLSYSVFSLLGLFLTFWAFKYTPWKSVSNWESHQFYPVPFWEYANHLGPIFYLGIPGLLLLSLSTIQNSKKPSDTRTKLAISQVPFWRKFTQPAVNLLIRMKKLLLAGEYVDSDERQHPSYQRESATIGFDKSDTKRLQVSWQQLEPNKFLVRSSSILTFSALFMILSGITKDSGLSTLRFFQTPVHIFLSIGTAYLLWILAKILAQSIHRISNFKFQISNLIYCLLVATTLLITLPAYSISLESQRQEWSTLYWNIYIDRESLKTLEKLKDISDVDDVVMGNDLVGQVVPTVSGNIVYVGHMVSTINFTQKFALTRSFFSGKMSLSEARQFLLDSHAKYLVTMYPEGEKVNPQTLPYLTPIDIGPTLQLYSISL